MWRFSKVNEQRFDFYKEKFETLDESKRFNETVFAHSQAAGQGTLEHNRDHRENFYLQTRTGIEELAHELETKVDFVSKLRSLIQ